jgi:hypothetical protein
MPLDHDQASGGILAGKRIAGERIAVVAASAPGPTPDNRQLGFALDQAQGNAMLEQWYAQDPDVDFIGLWHTHPADLVQPTPEDVQVAAKLLLDPASGAGELLIAIVAMGLDGPEIGWFYLSSEAARRGEACAAVAYEALDDGDPVFRVPDATADAVKTTDAATEPPVVAAPAPVSPRRRRWLVVGLASLLVVLLAGLAFARVANRPNGRAGRDASEDVVASGVATVTDAPPATMPLVGASAVAPQKSAPANTPTIVPAVAVTPPPEAPRPPSTATQSPAPIEVSASRIAGSPPRTPRPSPGRYPFTLRFAPMDAAYRQDFLRRMRNGGCAGCYNVEIVGPTPFTAMRIRVAGSRLPPLRNYQTPSPVAFTPRAAPYTLQAFDPEGKPLSEPLTVTVSEGESYLLELSAAGGT